METFIIIILVIVCFETSYMTLNRGVGYFGHKNSGMIFVDTSVLIDGRIIPLAQSGFIGRKLAIPRSVVGELQLLADQADTSKRIRARRGLDVVSELQALSEVDVVIFPDTRKAHEGVDNRLLKLAKKHHGALCTLDFNLNKVAKTEDIEVLNLNDLAMNLRIAYLPGEIIDLYLTQKGQESKQAVGYLEDGTMVVVENGNTKIGHKVKIRFTRSLQTEAGKMMFAELVGNNSGEQKPKQKKVPNTNKKNVSSVNNKNKKPNDQHHKTKSYGDKQEDKIVSLINEQ